MITHVFDTTAVLAHYFNEPGADAVNALFADKAVEVGIPALSLLELKSRLAASVTDAAEVKRAFQLYADELMTALPVTRDVTELADKILHDAKDGLTVTDAIVAATARQAGAVLVHRNAQLARLPSTLLRQQALPLEA
jgi:predicted nucleic acid-binding protein